MIFRLSCTRKYRDDVQTSNDSEQNIDVMTSVAYLLHVKQLAGCMYTVEAFYMLRSSNRLKSAMSVIIEILLKRLQRRCDGGNVKRRRTRENSVTRETYMKYFVKTCCSKLEYSRLVLTITQIANKKIISIKTKCVLVFYLF